jgi:fumarate hydratase, class I
MIKNAVISAQFVFPMCQDTGTAVIMGKKGQQVWTGGGDEASLSLGVYNAYANNNLRYSQQAPCPCTMKKTPAPTCPPK